MAAPLLLAAFTIPGLISAGIVSQYYRKSQISGRYQCILLDKSLERQISRKLEKTWGQKAILRHRQEENKEIAEAWTWVKQVSGLPSAGNCFVLDTDEEVFKVFHNGNLYISTAMIKGLEVEKVKRVLLHGAAHIVLSHQQEGLPCLKITTLILAYMCRNNHHFHYILKDYQMDARYNEVQEMEANLFGEKIMEGYKRFKCSDSL